MVENLIANKRLRMNEALSKLYGVHFFLFSYNWNGTQNHAKRRNKRKVKILPARKKEEGDKSQANQDLDDFFRNFNPGVAYFIAYTRTTECIPNSIFALLHYLDNDVELKTIDSRIKGGEEYDILTDKMVRELFQIVKDHDNDAVKS